jgi:putative two-component system response regulator
MERKTIFLVDDNIVNLNTGKNTLSALYKVATFGSGKILLKILEKNIPDLILLDVMMPEMDGYETLKAIKSNEKTAHIPVIFLTAKDDDDSEAEGFSLGAADYIAKPFSPPMLLKRIEMHLLLQTIAELAKESDTSTDSPEKRLTAIADALAEYNTQAANTGTF